MINNKESYENFAKNALEYYFSDKFSNLQKFESPDWVNEKVGVEVTRAITTNEGCIDAFFKKNKGKKYVDLPQKQLNNMGFNTEPSKSNITIFYEQRSKSNGTLSYIKNQESDLILFALTGGFGLVSDCSIAITNAVKNKIEKLNSQYLIKDENDLVVLIDEQLNYFVGQDEIIDETLRETIKRLSSLKQGTESKIEFDYIYLIFFDNIFVVDFKTLDYTRTIITADRLLILSQQSL